MRLGPLEWLVIAVQGAFNGGVISYASGHEFSTLLLAGNAVINAVLVVLYGILLFKRGFELGLGFRR